MYGGAAAIRYLPIFKVARKFRHGEPAGHPTVMTAVVVPSVHYVCRSGSRTYRDSNSCLDSRVVRSPFVNPCRALSAEPCASRSGKPVQIPTIPCSLCAAQTGGNCKMINRSKVDDRVRHFCRSTSVHLLPVVSAIFVFIGTF